jgi:glutaminase
VNPLTGKQAIRGEYVESILSVMGSCGMYDYAGEWLYRVGMPAKSGVAGGVVAVLPGQLGIGVFSPPLDSRGNSVRGLGVCDDISRSFDLHLFNTPEVTKSVIRLKFTAAQVSSNRIRTREEAQALKSEGGRIQVFQLQGNLFFSTAEVVVEDLMSSIAGLDTVIIDCKHVQSVNESASRLFCQVVCKSDDRGKKVVFTNAAHLHGLSRYMKAKLKARAEELFTTFDDTDAALEFCENRLLDQTLQTSTSGRMKPEQYILFAGLGAEELKVLEAILERRKFKRGDVIVAAGAPSGEMYFLASGCASARIQMAGGARKRLGTFSAGMVFGEMGVLEHAPRSAEVTADTEVECDLLKAGDFDKLGESYPRIKLTILRNLALLLSRNLRKRNQEFSVFNY